MDEGRLRSPVLNVSNRAQQLLTTVSRCFAVPFVAHATAQATSLRPWWHGLRPRWDNLSTVFTTGTASSVAGAAQHAPVRVMGAGGATLPQPSWRPRAGEVRFPNPEPWRDQRAELHKLSLTIVSPLVCI